jgi:YfiH family protein
VLDPWRPLEGTGADVAVTTRDGGVSTGPYRSLNLGLHVGDDPALVHENRRRAAEAFGADIEGLVFVRQVHGTAVKVVGRTDRAEPDAAEEADVLVTDQRGVVLAMLVADCVPIALYDPGAGIVCCVHAGWRGTAAGVAGAALEAMGRLGGVAGRMVAAIGPAVAREDYPVGPDVFVQLAQRCGAQTDADAYARQDPDGCWRVDLRKINRLALSEAGVPAEEIRMAPASTGPGTSFFSSRAAQPCGRFAMLVRLR